MFTVPFQDMFDDEENCHGGIMSYYSPAPSNSSSSQHGTPQSVSSDLSQFSPGTFRIRFLSFFNFDFNFKISLSQCLL